MKIYIWIFLGLLYRILFRSSAADKCSFLGFAAGANDGPRMRGSEVVTAEGEGVLRKKFAYRKISRVDSCKSF